MAKFHQVQIQGRSPEEIKAAEKKKREEEEKKSKPLPQKKYYDIRLEALVPCTLTYRVFAYDEHSALEEIARKTPANVKPNVSLKRDIKATVYDAGTSIIRFAKSFRF